MNNNDIKIRPHTFVHLVIEASNGSITVYGNEMSSIIRTYVFATEQAKEVIIPGDMLDHLIQALVEHKERLDGKIL